MIFAELERRLDKELAPLYEMVERAMLPKGQLTDRQISDGVMASLAASDRGVQGEEE